MIIKIIQWYLIDIVVHSQLLNGINPHVIVRTLQFEIGCTFLLAWLSGGGASVAHYVSSDFTLCVLLCVRLDGQAGSSGASTGHTRGSERSGNKLKSIKNHYDIKVVSTAQKPYYVRR